MDFRDMVESLDRKEQHARMQPGYYDGCTKIDWEADRMLDVMDRNYTITVATNQQWAEAHSLMRHR